MLGLSGIWTSAANTKVAGADSATDRFNSGGQRENRTWSYPMLRFLIVLLSRLLFCCSLIRVLSAFSSNLVR